jgi:hypothetical protein
VGQEHSIVFCPFDQITLLIVVRDKGDFLIMFHGDLLMSHTSVPLSADMADIVRMLLCKVRHYFIYVITGMQISEFFAHRRSRTRAFFTKASGT